MRKSRIRWRYGVVGVGLLIVMVGVTFASIPAWFIPLLRRGNVPVSVSTVAVRRSDLNVRLMAAGRVDSSNSTIIECELESIGISIRGLGLASSGASTILSVIPDGSTVKSGDVLCVLDSSDYEELGRQQAMTVDRCKADYQQAALNLDVARTAVREYREGIMLQYLKEMQGQIALTKADVERAGDRLAWTRRMCDKGYFPMAQLSADELTRDRLEFSLTRQETSLSLFKRFSAPKYLHILGSEVLSAEILENYQSRRLQRNEDRLVYLKRQIKKCTIRAPHDGFVIYANEEMRQIRIEPGMVVRQRQRLFYLPDLSRMEVVTMLHESVVKDVQAGQVANVRIEALHDGPIEGHVVSVKQVPIQTWFSEVKYFIATVKLDSIPRGLRPNMSAEVEITTVRRADALTVPPESVVYEDGQDFCLVAHEDYFERRAVKLGLTSEDRLEVTDGLAEGDEIVIDPTLVSVPTAPVEDAPIIDSAG